jgi:TIR domain/Bacterial Ig-like domain (group 2)
MSDIFISYASEERDRVLPLVSALERTGWSIFWDRTIPAGKTWRQVIGSEIRACRSVLVVWTENSVTSEWVLEEAETGKRRGILIPVLLDNVEPPFGFGNIQAANLTTWNGDSQALTFTRLVADITTILGQAPTVVKEAGRRRRSDAEAQRKADEEGLREQEHQRSEEDARQENQRRIEQEANRARLLAEERIPSEVEQAKKKSPTQLQPAPERQGASVPQRRDRRRLYAGGAALIVIGLAVAFWFFRPFGSKDADVKTIVSLGIQGKRELDVGEKTVLRVGGRFSDGSETAVTKNLDWHSSDDSVVVVSGGGQVEGRKNGFADITVRYEGIASAPLTLMVREETRPTEMIKGETRAVKADVAQVATKIQEHIKAAGSYRDRGDYSPALAELAKAKSLDPASKAVQSELESTTKACLAEQRIVLANLRCE